jgi:hypothetical protein
MDVVTVLFIVIPLLIGVFTYYYQPFQNSGYSASYDLTTMILTGCVLLAVLGSLIITPAMEADEALEVCGAATMEKQCYRLPELVCKNMWQKYESECRIEIKKDLEDRVTALIGPAVKKCTQRRFDKSLYYTRKNADEAPCADFFRSLSR